EGNHRQIWLKRLATVPASFPAAECCRAPLFPLFTRDVLNSGLLCQHCGGTVIDFEDLPKVFQKGIRSWAEDYSEAHGVAHWEEDRQRQVAHYEELFEEAATRAEQFLRRAALELLPPLLDYYPALVWEDQ